MTGRLAVAALLICGLAAGIAMYWLQVFAFYEEVTAEEAEVRLTSRATGTAEPVGFENFRGIDADSSPIRYRACFDLTDPQAAMVAAYVTYDRPDPLVAPGWFDCFDAEAIGGALASGAAVAFLGVANVEYGIDRVVAVMPDGRAWAWHQINACGEEVFDGNPLPEGCPPAPSSD